MKPDLDSLRAEIVEHLEQQGMLVFHCYSRGLAEGGGVSWDVAKYPDYRQFVAVAKRAGVAVMAVHHRAFSEESVAHSLSLLGIADLTGEDRRRLQRRFREFHNYVGFTCAVELSFDYQGRTHYFDLETEWYREYLTLMDEVHAAMPDEDYDEDDEEPAGGYYSQN